MGKGNRTDGMIKVHSLGYMYEKLKRNNSNVVERYQILGTTFILTGAVYEPKQTADDIQKAVGELIRCGTRLEWVINQIDPAKDRKDPRSVLADMIAKSKVKMIDVQSNPDSNFYDFIKRKLEDSINSPQYKNQLRKLGKTIREEIKPELTYANERKIYVASETQITLNSPVIVTLHSEFKRLEKRLLE